MKSLLSSGFYILLLMLFSRCAVNPTCPGSLLPIVEVQVNNTASNHDDYGTTGGFTECRARISNFAKFGGGNNFPGGVQVEFRNTLQNTSLNYSTTNSGSGSASVFSTLPENGGWLTFYVKGNSTNAIDKTAIIETATAGATCNEVVLSRKAMMIPTGAAPIASGGSAPRVEITINSVSNLDDYVTWSPTSCSIKWVGAADTSANLNVTLQNMSGTDHLRFANSSLAGGSTATNATLSLNLPGNGSAVRFYIAGNFASPSTNDKDAVFEVIDASSTQLLSREAAMVRVRKNANNLSTPERDRYLSALKKMDLTYNDYIDFVKTHSRDNSGSGGSIIAHTQAHFGSAFLAWHRIFVLHFERIIQAADPSVTVPYWKFDVNAPNIFTQDFFGSNSAGNMATLAATNPIVSWALPGEGVPVGIQRKTPYGDGGHPSLATEATTLALGSGASPTPYPYSSFKGMESNPHNRAHAFSGFTDASGNPLPGASWIGGSPSIAPRDPLFFSLHCNIDHLWAKWQWLRNRNDPNSILSYDLQGKVSAPAPGVPAANVPNLNNPSESPNNNRMLGQYGDDTMWPWDNITGGAAGSVNERPNIAILTPLPITLTAILPFAKPTVKSTVDYAGVTSTSPSTGLGFAYDDFSPY